MDLFLLQFKKMGTLSESEKISFAKELNNLKNIVTSKIDNKFKDLESDLINEKLKGEKIDVTLPTRSQLNGKIHPVSQVIDEISSIFSEIGFSVMEGPDVETEYNNFTALNTPDDHPARDMHDTFYLDKNKKDFIKNSHISSTN